LLFCKLDKIEVRLQSIDNICSGEKMTRISEIIVSAALASAISITALVVSAKANDDSAIIANYTNIAYATYEDALITAKTLDAAIDELVARPSEAHLDAARNAWLEARKPYQQTEVFRFGNVVVDEWEGRVNAWPLDEGLIDYVAGNYGGSSAENNLYTANVIANETIEINGRSVDVSTISPSLLSDVLHEAGGIEANVATGYHAIEFLLWGQDLNGTGPGSGERSYTDFDVINCTNGHCERRGQYLAAASRLLVSDLEEMVANWAPEGAAREVLTAGSTDKAFAAMLTGMGSLSYGELAGERMKLGLLLHDPEEEHDCFSDNTHNSHLYDAIGIRNVYMGEYRRIDGSMVSGPSISEKISNFDQSLDTELRTSLKVTIAAMNDIVSRAEGQEAYDQMIAEGNNEGNALVQKAIDALIDQAYSIEKAIAALNLDAIELESSDSLDNPNAVFQ
jgi:putative iron-regulated protein